ncbi:MAG: hypothetical protein ACLQFR_00825 [Streptosporangiaceae bacterium]
MAYLIFIVLIRAAGTSPAHQSAVNGAISDLVAFLGGYQEEVFRDLLKRASDTLVASARRNLERRSE